MTEREQKIIQPSEIGVSVADSVAVFRNEYMPHIKKRAEGINSEGKYIAVDSLRFENPSPDTVEQILVDAVTSGMQVATVVSLPDAEKTTIAVVTSPVPHSVLHALESPQAS